MEVHGATITAADAMPATAFGMTVIEETTSAYYKGGSTNGGSLNIVPNESGALAKLWATTNGTTDPIASQVIAATPNGLYFTVKGY